MFCSFLALLLAQGDERPVEMEVAINGKGDVFRGQAGEVAGKGFQACGVALPPMIRSW